jgi:hypothetical protein
VARARRRLDSLELRATSPSVPYSSRCARSVPVYHSVHAHPLHPDSGQHVPMCPCCPAFPLCPDVPCLSPIRDARPCHQAVGSKHMRPSNRASIAAAPAGRQGVPAVFATGTLRLGSPRFGMPPFWAMLPMECRRSGLCCPPVGPCVANMMAGGSVLNRIYTYSWLEPRLQRVREIFQSD